MVTHSRASRVRYSRTMRALTRAVDGSVSAWRVCVSQQRRASLSWCSWSPLGTLDRVSGRRGFSSADEASPLAFEMIEPPPGIPGAADAPLALVLHGLMGSGRNWRTFVRALSRRVADEGAPWRFALVDHIYHGRTNAELRHRAARNPPVPTGPDDPCPVDLAADAVARAARHIRRVQGFAHPTDFQSESRPGNDGDAFPAAAVIGHSLGGKIALRALSRVVSRATESESDSELEIGAEYESSRPRSQWWTLDSAPSAVASDSDPHGVRRVLDAIAALPRRFESREALAAALASRPESSRFPRDLVDWLGTNLAPVDPAAGAASPLGWVFDVEGARALYDAYARDDGALTTALEPPKGTEVHVVRAERSERWPEDTVARLRRRAADSESTTKFHVLRDAGHWLHVDNPEGLRDVLAPELVRLGKALAARGRRRGEENA